MPVDDSVVPAAACRFVARPVVDLMTELKTLTPTAPGIGMSPEQARSLIFGGQPWVLSVQGNGTNLGNAFATLQRGRLRCGLFVTLVSEIQGGDAFWNGVLDFVSRQDVTELRVKSVARPNPAAAIPRLGRETARFSNVKLYMLNLEKPDASSKFSSNHRRNIAKARKAGVHLIDLDPPEALRVHFDLTGLSLERRAKRGESTKLRASQDSVIGLLASGAGRLFQAALDGEVLSSKLVYVVGEYAYYHDGGTSPKGMSLGASHFLMSEIMAILKKEGIRSMNMGVAAETSGGLWRFKEGFDPDRWIVERTGFDFSSRYKIIKNGLRSLWPSGSRQSARAAGTASALK